MTKRILGLPADSVAEWVCKIFLYGLASYIRDSRLLSASKETSDKCKSGTYYSSEQEGSSIRGEFSNPSQNSHRDNNAKY